MLQTFYKALYDGINSVERKLNKQTTNVKYKIQNLEVTFLFSCLNRFCGESPSYTYTMLHIKFKI